MKRAYEQDSGDESSDDSSDEDTEISDEETYIPPRQERDDRQLLGALARDDRPYLLTTPSPTQATGILNERTPAFQSQMAQGRAGAESQFQQGILGLGQSGFNAIREAGLY